MGAGVVTCVVVLMGKGLARRGRVLGVGDDGVMMMRERDGGKRAILGVIGRRPWAEKAHACEQALSNDEGRVTLGDMRLL